MYLCISIQKQKDMATLKNTIAKAEKVSGTKVTKDDCNQYSFIYKTRVISFYANGTGSYRILQRFSFLENEWF